MNESNEQVRTGRVRIGYWINRGWDWFVEDLGIHILTALIAVVFLNIGVIFVAGPVFAGLAVVGLRKASSNQVDLKDFFDGFRHLLPALLSTLLICVFSVVGLIFFIVPGLVILAMYQFSYHFIVDRHQDFWEAMESSRKLVSQDYFGFTMFGVLLGLINLLGVALMGIGILASLPVTSLSITAAYLDFSGGLSEPTVSAQPVRID